MPWMATGSPTTKLLLAVIVTVVPVSVAAVIAALVTPVPLSCRATPLTVWLAELPKSRASVPPNGCEVPLPFSTTTPTPASATVLMTAEAPSMAVTTSWLIGMPVRMPWKMIV